MFGSVFWLKEFFYLSIPYLSRGHVSKGKPLNASEFISSINKTLAVQKFSWDILASELNKWKFILHEGAMHEVIVYVCVQKCEQECVYLYLQLFTI